MKAEQLWKIAQLKQKVQKTKLHLETSPEGCYVDRKAHQAYRLDILCPLGYHQAEDIAGTLGLDYAAQTVKEDEMEAMKTMIQNLKAWLRISYWACAIVEGGGNSNDLSQHLLIDQWIA